MNRGAGRRDVFRTVEQREYFLGLLADTHGRFNAEWHAYCLMGNHYHLLLRTPEGNLQRIMRHVNGLYTQFFNRCEGLDGPLFRGRYKAVLVEADTYWLGLTRYIHRNPSEAGIADDPAEYPWSSCRAYLGLAPAPSWLSTGYTLNAIGGNAPHQRYAAYLSGDSDEALKRFFSQQRLCPILGSESFRQRTLAGMEPNIDHPDLRSARVLPSAEQIIESTALYFGVPPASLYQSKRGRAVRSPARAMAMHLCQKVANFKLAEIATLFKLANYASAGAGIRDIRKQIAENAGLAEAEKTIILDLTPLD
jgi:REP element-mobilizing transposase RayT